MKNDLIGKKVRIVVGCSKFYRAGDIAVIKLYDKIDNDYRADFQGQGNAKVFGRGLWWIGSLSQGDFEVIEDAPAPLPIADAAFYEGELDKANKEIERLKALLNTPELHDFAEAVSLEAAHQVERWGMANDRSKSAENWFWLVGYLAGKALRAAITGDKEKALHHTISSAAALANWHAAIAADTSGAGIGADADIAPKAEGGREGERPGCKHCPKGSEIFERDCHYPDCVPDFLKVGGTC